MLTWAEGDAKSSAPGLHEFMEDDARDLQKRLMNKIIFELCRSEDVQADKGAVQCHDVKEAAIRNLILFIDGCMKGRVLDAAYSAEAKKLKYLAMAPNLADESDIAEAEQASFELNSNRQASFHKCITLFSTGMHLNQLAADFFLQRKNDEAHGASLTTLVGQLTKLSGVAEEFCPKRVTGIPSPTPGRNRVPNYELELIHAAKFGNGGHEHQKLWYT